MKRIVAFVVVLLSVLLVPAATGQTRSTPAARPVICERGECHGWSPRSAQPVESAGEVVLTFTGYEPGRVVYYTSDGDCSGYPLDPPDCGRPQARASEDYGAVKGEWIFTEAGTRTITIPILDDNDDEADHEAFTVNASTYDDVAEQTTWDNVVVRIADDDPRDDSEGPPAVATTATRDDRQSGSPPLATAPPPAPAPVPGAPVPAAVASPPDLEVELPAEDLRRGSGFVLTSEGSAEPAPERAGGRGSASWLVFGLGTAAVSVGALALLWRRRRWSPTRA